MPSSFKQQQQVNTGCRSQLIILTRLHKARSCCTDTQPVPCVCWSVVPAWHRGSQG